MTQIDKKSAWDRHWKAGHLSSLSSANQTAERPEAMAAWDQFFAYIQSGAIILDIATGNGIVPAFLQAHAKQTGKRLEVVAVDQADIDPLATLGDNADAVKGTLFLGGIEAEDLPFEDGWFDAVVGQYALEYTDTEKSVAEVARVLKSQGIIRFVCHAKDSGLLKFNAPKAEQSRFILEDSGVLEALDKAVGEAFSEKQGAGNGREVLRNKVEAARAHLKTMGNNPEFDQFLNTLIEAYIGRAEFGGLETFRAWLSSIREEIEGQIAMIKALEKAALDEADLVKLGEAFTNAGFGRLSLGKLEAGPDQDLLAYTIEGMKS